MNKYLNIMVVAFFSVLTAKYGIGYAIYIPIAFFIAYYNEKSLLLFLPLSLLSAYLNKTGIVELLIVDSMLIVYLLLLRRRNRPLIDGIYIFLVGAGISYFNVSLIGVNQYLMVLTLASMSTILFIYFRYNIDGVLAKQNTFRNFGFIEAIMGLCAVLGASTLSINGHNIGLYVALFYTMYLSTNTYYFQSFLFSMITMLILLLGKQCNEAILLPLIASVYAIGGLYGMVATCGIALVLWLFDVDSFNESILQVIIGVSIFFEAFKGLIVGKSNYKSEVVQNMYGEVVNDINREVLSFASFLDLFSRDFTSSHEYNQKLNEGMNNLFNNYCEGCSKKNECLKKKNELYMFFKNLILYAKRSDFDNCDDTSTSFYKKCRYAIEMRKSAMILSDKLNINSSHNKVQTLIGEINGISNILRQYTTEIVAKNMIDYNVLYSIRKSLRDYGFNITYFNVTKGYTNDFLIEVAIRGINFNEVSKVINKICDNYIINKTSIIYVCSRASKTYFNIVPKINYIIDYGTGAIASSGNTVNGDNYLIKELTNGKIIAAISDGMGKGYLASCESANTIHLIDEVTKTSLSTNTSLQILNTFFFIQDYLEKYTTLDYFELDKTTGEMFFYKMGATSSYLFHKNGTYEKIENSNLPFGLEEIVDAKCYQAEDGDLIIMTSDGVFENIEEEEDLRKYVLSIKDKSSQQIAFEITKFAKGAKRKDNDDISIITMKIIAA